MPKNTLMVNKMSDISGVQFAQPRLVVSEIKMLKFDVVFFLHRLQHFHMTFIYFYSWHRTD